MKCVLGVDGGGTKTECVAMDLAANVVARARGPASNPTRVGFESAAAGEKQVAEATIAAAKESVEIAALCARSGLTLNERVFQQLCATAPYVEAMTGRLYRERHWTEEPANIFRFGG